MAKIMAVNAGSSSIKFQLLEMPEETVIASGVMERIGLSEGIFTIKYNGLKEETHPVLPTHAEGVELLLHTLVAKGIVKSLDEISGVGHRVVQGGEYFKDSALVDEVVVDLHPLTTSAISINNVYLFFISYSSLKIIVLILLFLNFLSKFFSKIDNNWLYFITKI